jgi:hypothetical protein
MYVADFCVFIMFVMVNMFIENSILRLGTQYIDDNKVVVKEISVTSNRSHGTLFRLLFARAALKRSRRANWQLAIQAAWIVGKVNCSSALLDVLSGESSC